MATRYIDKVESLSDLRNLPNAGGVGIYQGKVYMNLGGNVSALANAPAFGNVLLVDYDHGSATDTRLPYSTIQLAVAAASHGDTILIRQRDMDTAGIAAGSADDPPGYLGDITITAGLDGLQLVGIGNGCSQMSQPCIRKGTTTTNPLLTIQAVGVGVHNLTFNGAGATGGGIKLDADGSTTDAGGAYISGCHFKNCKGSGNASTGGAIWFSSSGGSWYTTIIDNDFFDCRAGVVVVGTGASRPKDLKILGNRFYSSANTNVDCDLYLCGGDGVNGLLIDGNVFATVDKPAYASSPAAALYVKLTGCTNGIFCRNMIACLSGPTGNTELTWGAAGTAAYIPTTVRMAANYGEANVAGIGVEESGIATRT